MVYICECMYYTCRFGCCLFEKDKHNVTLKFFLWNAVLCRIFLSFFLIDNLMFPHFHRLFFFTFITYIAIYTYVYVYYFPTLVSNIGFLFFNLLLMNVSKTNLMQLQQFNNKSNNHSFRPKWIAWVDLDTRSI